MPRRPVADRLPRRGHGRIAFLLLALFAEMERTFTAERAAGARAIAGAKGRHLGRLVGHPADRVAHARLLNAQGETLGQIAAKTGIPRTSLHRYLADGAMTAEAGVPAGRPSAGRSSPGSACRGGSRRTGRPGSRTRA